MSSLGKRKYYGSSSSTAIMKKYKAAERKPTELEVKRLMARMLKTRGITPEVKFFTTIISGTALNNTVGAMTSLNLVAQGTDENNRIGDRIRIRSVEIRGNVASTNNLENGFLALLCDKQPNGAIPAMCSDFNSTAVTPYNCSSTVPPLAGCPIRNKNAAKRYTYYREKQWSANQPVAAAQYMTTGPSGFVFKKTFSTPLEIEFSNTTGVITSVGTNDLLFAYSSYVGSNSSISFYAQIHFTDA